MAGSSSTQPTFLLYVLGASPLPRVADFFDDVFGSGPDAVGLFTGPSDNWEGASLSHVVFRKVRTPVASLPSGVQGAAAGRPPPQFVLEAAATVDQAEDVTRFVRESLMPALADYTAGVVADPVDGLVYVGDPSKPKRSLPWNNLAGAPDPAADDWSDLV